MCYAAACTVAKETMKVGVSYLCSGLAAPMTPIQANNQSEIIIFVTGVVYLNVTWL